MLAGLALVGTGLSLPCPVRACPPYVQPTLRQQFSQAKLALVGSAANPRKIHVEGADCEENVTDIQVSGVLKSDPALVGMKRTQVSLHIPVPNPKQPPQLLIFLDVVDGKLTPSRAIDVEPPLLDYVKGLMALKGKPEAEALVFFARHLDSANEEVAGDAVEELAQAEHKDLRRAARCLSAEQLRRLLRDPKTAPVIVGMASVLLGLCGSEDDVKLLRKRIAKVSLNAPTPLDRLLVGYLLLEHKAGHGKRALELLHHYLGDRSLEFLARYAALRALRFFWNERPDVISRQDRLESVGLLLEDTDLADFAIEDLRKWHAWEMAGRVVELYGRETHQVPIIRRAIMRFALHCPVAQAQELVRVQRVADAQFVQDMEELLKLEDP
jgi:hypothetical protein